MFQLRLTIVEALGQMSHIMSTDKLQAELPKLLPAVFSLYKKHQEPFHITQVRGSKDSSLPSSDIYFATLYQLKSCRTLNV